MPDDSQLKEGKLTITRQDLENEEDIVDDAGAQPKDSKGDPDTKPNLVE